ncbi:hypothetical protein ACJX0J_029346, partial [Zea mays]
ATLQALLFIVAIQPLLSISAVVSKVDMHNWMYFVGPNKTLIDHLGDVYGLDTFNRDMMFQMKILLLNFFYFQFYILILGTNGVQILKRDNIAHELFCVSSEMT